MRDSALSILFDRRFEEECLNSCSDAAKQREEELKRQGWTRMFIADEPRLSEAVELYKSLGYEVHLEPTTFNEADETCRACLKVNCGKCWTIYTRKKDDASEAE